MSAAAEGQARSARRRATGPPPTCDRRAPANVMEVAMSAAAEGQARSARRRAIGQTPTLDRRATTSVIEVAP